MSRWLDAARPLTALTATNLETRLAFLIVVAADYRAKGKADPELEDAILTTEAALRDA